VLWGRGGGRCACLRAFCSPTCSRQQSGCIRIAGQPHRLHPGCSRPHTELHPACSRQQLHFQTNGGQRDSLFGAFLRRWLKTAHAHSIHFPQRMLRKRPDTEHLVRRFTFLHLAVLRIRFTFHNAARHYFQTYRRDDDLFCGKSCAHSRTFARAHPSSPFSGPKVDSSVEKKYLVFCIFAMPNMRDVLAHKNLPLILYRYTVYQKEVFGGLPRVFSDKRKTIIFFSGTFLCVKFHCVKFF
jgi:hypothetical protein